MARFLEIQRNTPHSYYLNLEMIENVDTNTHEVFTSTDDCYPLDEEDFSRVMQFVNDNKWEDWR